MASANGKKILLVDDAEDIQMLVRKLLERKGYEVASAGNGKEALDFLESSPILPNLIILDLMMPVMDGFEFRARQRSDSRFSKIPVVIVTADSNVKQNQAGLDPQQLIAKPFNIVLLLEAVAQHASSIDCR